LKRLLANISLLALFFSSVQAQIVSDISVSKDSIGLGEATTIFYKLTIPDPSIIKHLDFSGYDEIESYIPPEADTLTNPYFAEIDWIAPFADENITKIKLNPSLLIKGNRGYEYRDTFQATFWDIGIFPIDHPVVEMDTSSTTEVMKLQVPYIRVIPPMHLVNPDTTSALLPIKTILPESKTLEDYLLWLYILLAIIAIGLLLYFLLRPKPEAVITTKTIKIIPSHTLALNALQDLRLKKLYQKGELKAFQSELTFIIREYLEKRFGINALESTTGQISRALKKQDFEMAHENDLMEILQIADLVKFAKATPSEDIHEKFLVKAENFVDQTKNHEEVEREEIIEIKSKEESTISSTASSINTYFGRFKNSAEEKGPLESYVSNKVNDKNIGPKNESQ